MKNGLKITILLLITTELVLSSSLDISKCGCMCRNDQDHTLSSQFLAPQKSKNEFFQNIKGIRGSPGLQGNTGERGEDGPAGRLGPRGHPSKDLLSDKKSLPASCKEISKTTNQSGIYTIHLKGTSKATQVYCDMTKAGGGWTLVASIHENNQDGKCTSGDNWSGNQSPNGPPMKSWENFLTFGHIEGATSGDYKSSAYWGYLAKDLMVWHVPINTLPQDWDRASTFQYYTDNNFLSRYGGNLQTLYHKYYSLEPQPSKDVSSLISQWVSTSGLHTVLQSIRDDIPHFFSYEVSNDETAIRDGGEDMYDGGNVISYSVGRDNYNRVTYGKRYLDFDSETEIISFTDKPFLFLMWIGNPSGAIADFGIKVSSNTGADGNGRYDSSHGSAYVADLRCDYKFFTTYETNDPSIGELYFSCSSPRWNSTAGSFETDLWSSQTDSLQNSVYTSHNPQNIMMGYMLLSNFYEGNSVRMSPHEVERSLRTLMAAMNSLRPRRYISCGDANESLTVPVNFLKGTSHSLLETIPEASRKNIEAGYIQIRPTSFNGDTYAFCPGIKVSCDPGRVCLGSLAMDEDRMYNRHITDCGDFPKPAPFLSQSLSALLGPFAVPSPGRFPGYFPRPLTTAVPYMLSPGSPITDSFINPVSGTPHVASSNYMSAPSELYALNSNFTILIFAK